MKRQLTREQAVKVYTAAARALLERAVEDRHDDIDICYDFARDTAYATSGGCVLSGDVVVMSNLGFEEFGADASVVDVADSDDIARKTVDAMLDGELPEVEIRHDAWFRKFSEGA